MRGKEAAMETTTDGARRPGRMRGDSLYFDGCQTYLEAEQNLGQGLAEEGANGNVSLVVSNTKEEVRWLHPYPEFREKARAAKGLFRIS